VLDYRCRLCTRTKSLLRRRCRSGSWERLQPYHFVQYIEVRYIEQQAFLSRMDLRDVFAANLLRLRSVKGLAQDDLEGVGKLACRATTPV
jgi:hypothetical protein